MKNDECRIQTQNKPQIDYLGLLPILHSSFIILHFPFLDNPVMHRTICPSPPRWGVGREVQLVAGWVDANEPDFAV
jgi:hypothetical protein